MKAVGQQRIETELEENKRQMAKTDDKDLLRELEDENKQLKKEATDLKLYKNN